jgi:hypothetical protein
MEPLFDTVAASQWLAAHGVTRTPATLRKLRCLGNGPVYRLLNARPVYTAPDLEAWIESRLSRPFASTSEADTRTSARP